MKCPVDDETLVMADRGGVEIDYCPKCRGVWLDRGELDKIIERAAAAAPSAPAQAAPPPVPQQHAPQHQQPPQYQPPPQYQQPHYQQPQGRPYKHDDDDYRYGYKKKRRESFLGELFDF
jgi:Zn-finger nucleic acid-binding protein